MKCGANVGNRLRVLVVYFYRIILVYCFVLFTMEIVAVIVNWKSIGALYYWFYIVVWGFQGWASFAVILTKPDVGKMVHDLFACRLCCPRKQTESTNDAVGVATTTISEASETGEESIQPHHSSQHEHRPEREDERTNGQDRREQFRTERYRRDQLRKRISTAFISGITNYLSDDEGDEEDGSSSSEESESM